MSNHKKLIVVIGMHRSGTSAIARGLISLGVQLGNRLYPAIEGDNDKGFWEDIDINTLNNEILELINKEWHYLTVITQDEIRIIHQKDYFIRAVKLLKQKTKGFEFFGIKDPRISILLPFWKEVFSFLKYEVHYIIAVRHPMSVAKSLFKRDGFDFDKSYLLWQSHVINSLSGTIGCSRIVVDYDKLIQYPEKELKRIANAFNLEIDSRELEIYTTEFLDNNLRHSIHKADDLLFDEKASALVRDVFDIIMELSTTLQIDEDSLTQNIEKWEKEILYLTPVLAIADKLTKQISTINQVIHDQSLQISTLVQIESTQEKQIEAGNAIVEAKNRELDHIKTVLDQKEIELNKKNNDLNIIKAELNQKNEELNQKNEELNLKNEEQNQKDKQLNQKNEELYQKNEQLNQKDKQLNQKNEELNQKNEELNQKDKQLIQKNEELNQKDKQLIQKNEELNQKIEEISQIITSRSWQITKPLRAIFEILRNFSAILVLKKIAWYTSKVIFHLLPFSGRIKERLKNLFFFKYHDLYNTIKAGEIGSVIEHGTTNIEVSLRKNSNRIIQRIAYKENIPIPEMPVKVLAFYLPQFHAIPENDAWWGEGFTEWTNVKPAQPQFEGHYQPHVPVELGYYNLLDIKVQERQVEIAKNYGIGGFCFHYYWFNGKRLLEKPIENYLLNPQLDLPFCISWANENWTRRWDGRENDILMKQHHSPEDDLAFITHVSKYLLDKRYIRINNKPLLIVYRPGLLPSAKETAESWRNWCRANGIGEIYLAYVQSFEKTDPAKIGYDVAIEFPPNNFYPPIITHLVKPTSKDFNCNIYDWETIVKRSENYELPDYKLFRGVCPSWDNTPRRKSESHIFVNSHPDDFQKWVYNAAKDTISRFESTDERLVFVNAWNEWAEGAHLEPDEKHGYAYLQNIYEVLRKLANTKMDISSKDNV